MFKNVKYSKVSENIIHQIRRAILEGKLKLGDRLPPEKELLQNFKVSKSTLREALRALETLGFLEIKQGAGGGPFVVEVDMETARDGLINFLHFKNLSIENLSEVRLIIEPYVAEHAAKKISKEDLIELEENILESDKEILLGDISHYHEIHFHRKLASVLENPIIMLVIDFVEDLLKDTKDVLKPDRSFSQKVLNAHKRIYKALLNRNAKKARQEMEKHVLEVERDLAALRNNYDLKEPVLLRTYQKGI